MRKVALCVISLCLAGVVSGQQQDSSGSSGNQFKPQISNQQFNAQLAIGFNYDLLRSPLDVSFEHPRGYFGFNIPFQQGIALRSIPQIDQMFADTTIFTDGEEFKPQATASQNPNASVMVDVPMMGGVASFSYIQNFYFDYQNILGNPSLLIKPDSLPQGISNLIIRGGVNVPMDVSMSWESMTFGYAYQVNDMFTFALNLSRHVFRLDISGKVDANILGQIVVDPNNIGNNAGNSAVPLPKIPINLDYPSDQIYGDAEGHYEADVWTPTVALKVWRFSLTSRFGIDTRAHGYFEAKYSVPFFIDPKTFQMPNYFNDPKALQAKISDPQFLSELETNAVDSISYQTNSDLIWKMPSGHTLTFDIIPDHLTLSYTKLFGDVSINLDNIYKSQKATEANSTRDSLSDSVSLDVGVHVDNIILLQAKLWNAYVNAGIFQMDFESAGKQHLLSKVMPVKMGGDAMMPVLNLGAALGTRMQLLLELDVLPLPAVKTGIIYYF